MRNTLSEFLIKILSLKLNFAAHHQPYNPRMAFPPFMLRYIDQHQYDGEKKQQHILDSSVHSDATSVNSVSHLRHYGSETETSRLCNIFSSGHNMQTVSIC